MIRWEREDPLLQYKEQIQYEEILALRKEREVMLHTPHWEKVREPLSRLEVPTERYEIVCNESVVRVGMEGDLAADQSKALQDAIQGMIPWRKGPFAFFGETIDAEWRSDLKWDRIDKELADLTNKRVIDIGCNNGYYMFRALEANPRLMYGIDPSERTLYQFELFQRYLQDPRFQYDLLGIEHVPLFPGFFDVALCMGILYHHKNPYQMLMDVRDCLRPGGTLIMENIVIPGDEPMSIIVPDRYAMMRNVYFITTVPALEVLLKRSGFVDLELLDMSKVTFEEQRRTAYAPYQSLEDFLDPDNQDLTVEGFPAPHRAVIKATRRAG